MPHSLFGLLVPPMVFESIGSISTHHKHNGFVSGRWNHRQSPGRWAARGLREALRERCRAPPLQKVPAWSSCAPGTLESPTAEHGSVGIKVSWVPLLTEVVSYSTRASKHLLLVKGTVGRCLPWATPSFHLLRAWMGHGAVPSRWAQPAPWVPPWLPCCDTQLDLLCVCWRSYWPGEMWHYNRAVLVCFRVSSTEGTSQRGCFKRSAWSGQCGER